MEEITPQTGEVSREAIVTQLYRAGRKKKTHLMIPGFCIVYGTKPERRKIAFQHLSLCTEIISAKLRQQRMETGSTIYSTNMA